MNLVTNRTAGAKYNLSDDCNRVESAVATLQAALNAAGCNLNMTIKTDWAVTDKPTQSDMARYLENISTIRAALTALSTTPAVPDSMRYLTYSTANAIEKILADCDAMITRMQHTVNLGWALGIADIGLYGGLA